MAGEGLKKMSRRWRIGSISSWGSRTRLLEAVREVTEGEKVQEAQLLLNANWADDDRTVAALLTAGADDGGGH
jgi:hypothetical protein